MHNPFELFASYFSSTSLPALITCTTVDIDRRPCTSMIDIKDFDVTKLGFSSNPDSPVIKNLESSSHISLLFYFEQSEQIQIRVSARSKLENVPFISCIPSMFEFWIGSEVRLHKRYIFSLFEENEWKISMLYP